MLLAISSLPNRWFLEISPRRVRLNRLDSNCSRAPAHRLHESGEPLVATRGQLLSLRYVSDTHPLDLKGRENLFLLDHVRTVPYLILLGLGFHDCRCDNPLHLAMRGENAAHCRLHGLLVLQLLLAFFFLSQYSFYFFFDIVV